MGKMEKKELDYYYSNIPNKTAEQIKTINLLKEHKKTLPKMKTVRINRNTLIEVPADITEKKLKQKLQKWNNYMQQ